MPMHVYDNMSGQINLQFVKLINRKSILYRTPKDFLFNNLHLLQN
jgi:hypothetical protein